MHRKSSKSTKRILSRVLEYLVTLFIIVSLNFLLPRLLPGSPILNLANETDQGIMLTEKQIAFYTEFYGLDKPVMTQYFSYLKNLLHLDFGTSIMYNVAVIDYVKARFIWSFIMMGSSLILSFLIGSIMGSISAYKRNSVIDKSMYYGMMGLAEIPAFIMGFVLLFVFAVRLKMFPLYGAYTFYLKYGSWWVQFCDIVRHAVLPVCTLTLSRVASFYFISRANVISVLDKDYIRSAKAKGLPSGRIITKHALRNALLPIVTNLFMGLGGMIGGTILVENVFSYPGLGMLMREAVSDRDYPLIQGLFLFVTVFTLTANLLADLVYKRIDPRVK